MHRTRRSTSRDQSVVSNARRAAAIARSASPTVASAAVPSTASVDGEIVSYVAPPSAGTSSPSTSNRSSCHIVMSPKILVMRIRLVPLRPDGYGNRERLFPLGGNRILTHVFEAVSSRLGLRDWVFETGG